MVAAAAPANPPSITVLTSARRPDDGALASAFCSRGEDPTRGRTTAKLRPVTAPHTTWPTRLPKKALAVAMPQSTGSPRMSGRSVSGPTNQKNAP